MNQYRNWIIAGVLLCALYVILSAFGTHALKSKLDAKSLDTYHTALKFLILHAMGLILINFIGSEWTLDLKYVNLMILTGLLLFSGSLLLHSTKSLIGLESSIFAMFAPFGGVSFVVAWIVLAIKLIRK